MMAYTMPKQRKTEAHAIHILPHSIFILAYFCTILAWKDLFCNRSHLVARISSYEIGDFEQNFQ